MRDAISPIRSKRYEAWIMEEHGRKAGVRAGQYSIQGNEVQAHLDKWTRAGYILELEGSMINIVDPESNDVQTDVKNRKAGKRVGQYTLSNP